MPEVIVGRRGASAHNAPPSFLCSWHAVGLNAGWVHVTGELNLATSPLFRRTLREALRRARLLMLDLRGLSFIDCSGAHVILDVAGEAEQDGDQLLIVRGPAQLAPLLAASSSEVAA